MCGGHVTDFWIFDPPNISKTLKAAYFKLAIEMDSSEYYGKNA